MDKEEFRRQREALKIKQADLATILMVKQAQVSQWESGVRALPREIADARFLNEIGTLRMQQRFEGYPEPFVATIRALDRFELEYKVVELRAMSAEGLIHAARAYGCTVTDATGDAIVPALADAFDVGTDAVSIYRRGALWDGPAYELRHDGAPTRVPGLDDRVYPGTALFADSRSAIDLVFLHLGKPRLGGANVVNEAGYEVVGAGRIGAAYATQTGEES